MEAEARQGCSTPTSGSFTYMDDYGIRYSVEWETTLSGFDITTIIMDPRVPGQADQGYRQGRALFRRGLVTADRQIMVDTDDGYTIISAGGTQEVSFFQHSFPCGPAPTDPFCYHLDNILSEEIEIVAGCGPRWTDPDLEDDDIVTWGDVVDGTGDVDVVDMSPQTFQWIDVWGNDDLIDSTCP